MLQDFYLFQGSRIGIINSKLASRVFSLLTALRISLGKWRGNVKILQIVCSKPVFFSLRFIGFFCCCFRIGVHFAKG